MSYKTSSLVFLAVGLVVGFPFYLSYVVNSPAEAKKLESQGINKKKTPKINNNIPTARILLFFFITPIIDVIIPTKQNMPPIINNNVFTGKSSPIFICLIN
jgi:hypothetical protein